MNKFPFYHFNWYNKFGTIPSEYREAMSYEEQILWLCEQIRQLKIGSASYNYDMLENKPSINGITLQGNLTSRELGLDFNYLFATNKPSINNVTLQGNKSLDELGIQGKLTAGTGIRIIGNTISATGGGGGTSSYLDLENKPTLNGIEIVGDKESFDYLIQPLLQVDLATTKGSVYDLAYIQEGAIVPYKVREIPTNNTSHLGLKIFKDDYLDITGKYDLYKVSQNHEMQIIYTTGEVAEHGYFRSLSNGELYINFWDIQENVPQVKEYYSGEQLHGEHTLIKNNIKGWDNDNSIFMNLNFPYELVDNSRYTFGYFNLPEGNISVGSELPPYTSELNHKFVQFAVSENLSSTFAVNGKALNIPMWFTTKLVGETEIITSASENNINSGNHLTDITINIPAEATYIYFQFSDINMLPPLINISKITDISSQGASNYNNLLNKPQINGITISGNKGLDEYGLNQNGGIAVTKGGLLTDTDSRLNRNSDLISGSRYDFDNLNVGDSIDNPNVISSANAKRYSLVLTEETEVNFLGNFEYIIVDYYSRKILEKVSDNNFDSGILAHYTKQLSDVTKQIYINFYQVDDYTPTFYDVYNGQKLHNFRRHTLQYFDKYFNQLDEKPLNSNVTYDLTGLTVGDTWTSATISQVNTASSSKIEGKSFYPNEFKVQVKGIGQIIFVSLSNKVIAIRSFNSTSEYKTFDTYEALDIYVNFTNTNTATPSLKTSTFTEVIETLTGNIVVENGTICSLSSGFYQTGDYSIYLGQDIMYGNSEVVYFNANTQKFYNGLKFLEYSFLDNAWGYGYSDSSIVQEITSSGSYTNIPTTSAVASFVKTKSNSITNNITVNSPITDTKTLNSSTGIYNHVLGLNGSAIETLLAGKTITNLDAGENYILTSLAEGIYRLNTSSQSICSIYKTQVTPSELIYSGQGGSRSNDYAYMIVTRLTATSSSSRQCYIFGGASLNGKILYDTSSTSHTAKTLDLEKDFVSSSYVTDIWKGTQAEYDAITTPSATTLYIITD